MTTKFRLLQLLIICIGGLVFSQKKDNNALLLKPSIGLSSPQNDFKIFADSGFNFGIAADQYFSNKFALGLDLNYQNNSFLYPFLFQDLPNSFTVNTNEQGSWSTTSVLFGPTLKLGSGKFNTELYAKGGISFIKTPSASAVIENITVFNLNEERSTGFGVATGLRFNYAISPKISVFVNPQFSWFGNEIKYQIRDFTVIPGNTEQVAEDQINFEQDFNGETIKPSTISINAGISINLGGNTKDKVEEDPTLINPPLCDIVLDKIFCKNTTPILKLAGTWSGYNPNYSKAFEVFDGTNLINTNIVGNNSALGSSSGSFTGNATVSGFNGANLTAVFKIYDLTGAVVCTSQVLNINVVSCNPPYCDISFIDAVCHNQNTQLNFTYNWSSYSPTWTKKIEVFSGTTLLNPNTTPSVLGQTNGSNPFSLNVSNSLQGQPLKAVVSIYANNGNLITSCFVDFTFTGCNTNPECDFQVDPTLFTCDINTITYRGISTWNNQPIGSTIDIIATDASGNPIPLTFNPSNLPLTITTTFAGIATHDITFPSSFAGQPITLIMRITNPTTGVSKSCGGLDFQLPECENVPLCELIPEIKSCIYNGKTEVNFTANWLNFLNPLGYTTELSLFDQNRNPINVNIPGNNSGIGVAGTRSFLVDLSNYEGQTITARLNVCNPSGKNCCGKEITIEIPKCCWDCDNIDTFTNTSAANQVGNQYVVEADMTTSKPVTRVVAVLDYFRAKELPGRAVVPVNFEFSSTSRVNTNPVNLMGSLTGFRSTLLQYDFSPNVNNVNFNLLIDNYYQKEMLQYRIKVTTYFDDGTYCDRFLNN